jgi:hypothetical protein
VKAATVALRDAILAALRESDCLTTNEVCRAVLTPDAMVHGHRLSDMPDGWAPDYQRVYVNLRALMKRQLVLQAPPSSHGLRQSIWLLDPIYRAELDAEDEASELEAAYAAPAHEKETG